MAKIAKYLTCLLIVCILQKTAITQSNHTLYFMEFTPQTAHVNPAYIPENHTLNIGLPLISGIYSYVGNSGFHINDFVRYDEDGSYLAVDEAIAGMDAMNYLTSELRYEWLRFGYIYADHYFSLGVTEQVHTQFSYPRSLLEFAWYGNGAYLGETIDISNIAVNHTHFRSIWLNYATTILDNFKVGVRGRYLSGLSNIETLESKLALTTDELTYHLNATGSLHLRTAGLFTMVDQEQFDRNQYFFNFNNPGYAFDVGITWQAIENLIISAQMLDFGQIHWREDTRHFLQPTIDLDFEGLHLNDFIIFDEDNNAQFDEIGLQNLLDSVAGLFNPEEFEEAYITNLPPRFLMSAKYHLNKHHTFGAMIELAQAMDEWKYNWAVAYNIKLGQIFEAQTNLSMYNSRRVNVGLGIAFNAGFFQIYALTDNIIAAFFPTGAQNAHFHVGTTLLFGRG